MSLPASVYTQPGGGTVPGQQTASLQQTMSNAVASGVQGNPNNMPSDAALSGAFAGANKNLAEMQTPGSRQSFLNNSDLPAMSQNYDALAKQLFEYDTGVLNPKFAGTNPGTPSDAVSFGRVEASPLGMTVGSADLPASSGMYNANPKYAYSSQIDQGNSIVDLLNYLNNSIGSQFKSRANTYASTVQSQKDLVDSIFKVMGLKADLVNKEKDRQAAQAAKGGTGSIPDAENHAAQDAKKGVTFTDLAMRYASTLPMYRIREIYNDANYYKKPARESDSDIAAMIAGTKPTAQQAKEKATKQKSDAYDLTKGTVQNILSQYKNLGALDKGGLVGSLLTNNPYGAGHTYEQQRKGLVIALKDLAGAGTGSGVRITNAEIKTWSDLLPSPRDTDNQVKTKLQSLNKQLTQKFGKGLDPEYVGGAQAGNKGTVVMTGPKGSFNVPADKVEVFKRNGYK